MVFRLVDLFMFMGGGIMDRSLPTVLQYCTTAAVDVCGVFFQRWRVSVQVVSTTDFAPYVMYDVSCVYDNHSLARSALRVSVGRY